MRIRSLKPGFFSSEDVAELSFRQRLLWQGLWCYCDDEGRGKANLALIKAAVWPLDPVTEQEIQDDLLALHRAGRIVLYKAGTARLLQVANWGEHQHPNRPQRSKLPPPPLTEGSLIVHEQRSESAVTTSRNVTDTGSNRATDDAVNTHGAFTSGEEGRGEEGRGRARTREQPPTENPDPDDDSEYCPQHRPSGTDQPCGNCRRYRANADRKRAEKRRADSTSRSEAAKADYAARALAIRNCRLCGDDGYRLLADGEIGGLCDHTARDTAGRLAEARALAGLTRETAEATP